MNTNQNFDRPFDCLKIELETKNPFSFPLKFSQVSGTELKFPLSAVVLKILLQVFLSLTKRGLSTGSMGIQDTETLDGLLDGGYIY